MKKSKLAQLLANVEKKEDSYQDSSAFEAVLYSHNITQSQFGGVNQGCSNGGCQSGTNSGCSNTSCGNHTRNYNCDNHQ